MKKKLQPASASPAKKRSVKTRPPGPGPGRPTKEQAEMRKLELLDKALDHFLEDGYERATIEGIAASVGMAKRTVYAQSGGKKALFKAALKRAINEWVIPIERLRAAETDDLEQTLLKVGQMLVDNIMTPAGLRLLRISNAEANRMPEISAYAYEQGTKQTITYLADLFRRRINPEMPDAEDAALAFLYLVVGGPPSLTVWGVKVKQTEINKHTRYCVTMFLYGLLSDKLR